MESPLQIKPPAVGGVILALLSFVVISQGTFIGDFLLWLFPDSWIFFLIKYHAIIGSLALMIIFIQWTKNVYVLLGIGVLFFLFIQFGLKRAGIGSTGITMPLLQSLFFALIFSPERNEFSWQSLKRREFL